MAYGQNYQQFPAQQQVTFHGLRPGVKCRIRIRAMDGEGNLGPYSDPVDIVAGLGDIPQSHDALAGVNVAGCPLGVVVQWNAKAEAKGYEIYATKGQTSPPDPDPSDKTQLVYRGNARKVTIKAEDNDIVKVKILWYDQFGRKSLGVNLASATALSAAGS